VRKSSEKASFGGCLKNGKSDGSKGWRRIWQKLWFPIMGLGAFLWFLIRVIPKPSRASYPCQRAAFPLATSFIIWLTGMFSGALFFGRLKRKFLKIPYLIVALSIVAIVVATGWSFHWFPGKVAAAPVRLAPSTVAIVQSTQARAGNIQYDEIKSLVKQACDLAGGLETVVQNGDVVVIKPNLVTYNSNGRNLAPEVNGTTTDWRVTKAVVELVRRINPDGKIYVMEGASVPTQRAFDVLKYSLANFPGADLVVTLDQDCGSWQDTNSDGIVKVGLPNGRYKKEYYLNRKIKEADVFISLSCLKTHWSCGISGSVKNIGMGAAPPNIYGYSATNPWRNNMVNHNTDDLDQELSDFYECRPAEFTIIDGLQGLQNGPISANTSDRMNMRLILAGKDAVAVDTICGLVMNWDPESINYLKYLNSDSFGNLDTACINVVGKKVDQVRKNFAGRGRGTKVTDKTAPTLTVNSAAAQGNTLRLSLAVGPDCVKAEIYLDGELQLPALTSNFSNIVIDTNGLSSGSHSVSVNAYDRFLNRTEKTVTVYGQGGGPSSPPDSSGN
jgi:uncharacterized protein (DUF362 family)